MLTIYIFLKLVSMPLRSSSAENAGWSCFSLQVVWDQRHVSTLVSNSRQQSVQMGYSGFLEQNVNKVTCNLHSEVSELNIHSDTIRRTTNCIVVERSPLLPTQKDRSPMLILCHANVRAVKSKTACLREYISSIDMDIFSFTETWLTEKDTAAKLEIYFPESHSFI